MTQQLKKPKRECSPLRLRIDGQGRQRRRKRGFTLIELVIVMVITAIMAASLVVFLRPVIVGYMDSRRRAELTDNADTALRRMGRDVRMAVPNSIRSPNDQCFELLPTMSGGRYRMAADTINDAASCADPTNCSLPLDTSQPSSGFDVLSPLSAMPAIGDWVVVGNQDANDAYSGATRAAITNVSVPSAAFGQRRFAFASTQFPVGYNGGRFSVVADNAGSPAVFYICDAAGGIDGLGNGSGTLFRLERPFVPAYPAACPAPTGASVLAANVSRCSFIYSPSTGSTQQRGFVSMEVELTQANESVTLSFGAHTDNVP